MQLLNIEPRKLEDGSGYTFALHFLAADGTRPVAVLGAHELMSYRESVALIVQQTGRVALDHDAEGLPAEQGNRFWRLRVSSFLNAPPPPAQQQQTKNPKIN